MRKHFVAYTLLCILLLGTNAWWAYVTIDTAVTSSYRDAELHEARMAVRQSLELIPRIACASLSKDEFVKSAAISDDPSGTFEKDGHVWIGVLGFSFDGTGRVTGATTVWSTLK
jgi:hypothetical protein